MQESDSHDVSHAREPVTAPLGIKFPDTNSLPIEDVLECAKAADASGFESLWMSDYATGDVFSLLSACAVVTERIKLATGVAIVFNRAPTTLSMAAASLDTISSGRHMLGLGTGHRGIVEDQNGLVYERPVRRLVDCTEITRELVANGEVSYRGEIFSLDYKPWVGFYRLRIPVMFAPFVESSARRAGRMADGTLLTLVTPERVRTVANWVAEGAAEAGRSPAEIELGAYLWTIVAPGEETSAAGRDLIKRQIAWYASELPLYADLLRDSGFGENVDRVAELWQAGEPDAALAAVADDLVDGVGLIGDVDTCRARVDEYRAAGLHRPVLYPMPLSSRQTKQAFMATLDVLA